MGFLDYLTKGQPSVASAENSEPPSALSLLSNNTMVRGETDEVGNPKLPASKESQQARHSTESTSRLSVVLPRKDTKLLELENEHLKLLNAYSALRSENKHLADRTTDAEADSQSLRTRLMTLQQELAACKDDLFRLQPLVPVPDSEVQNDYESISQQIVNWIDEEIRNFEKAHPHTPTDTFYSPGDHSSLTTLLKKHPDAGEYLIRQRIHRCLQDHVLNKHIYLLGLPKDITQALQAAEQSMARSGPPRDVADSTSINTWRSETLNALTTTTDFSKYKDDLLQSITTDLFESLSEIFPIIMNNHESMMRLYWQIMQPAAKLAVKVQVSVSTYRFRRTLTKNPLMHYVIGVSHLQANKFIDITTNKTLKPDSAVIPNKDGNIGQALMLLEPALVRLDQNDKDIDLRKAVYLVELDAPIRKRRP